MIPGREYSFSSILQLLKTSLPVVVVLGIAGGVAGRAYVRGVADVYRSQATLLVQPQLVPQAFSKSMINQSLDDRLRTMSIRVLAPEQLARVAAELNVYGSLDPEQAAGRMASAVSVSVLRADAFRVGFMHRNPAAAASVAQRLAEAFVEENLRTRSGVADETNQFMETQLERTRQQLTINEQKLENYRRTYSGQLPSQLSSNLQGIQNSQVQLRAVQEAIQQDRDRKLKLDQTLASLQSKEAETLEPPSDSTAKDPFAEADPFKDQILELRGREAQRQLPHLERTLQSLQLQLKPDHPDVVRLKRVIAELERRVRADLETNKGEARHEPDSAQIAASGRSLDQLRAEIAAVEDRLAKRVAEEQRLDEQVRRYQQRVELIPTRETEMTMLMRDYDTLREDYRGLLAKKQEAQMTAEVERRNVGESFKIIEPAQVPGRPFSPDRLGYLLKGAGIGLGLGVFLLAWREYRNDTLRTEGEIINGLGVQVIAFLPIVATEREGRRVRTQRLILVASATGLVLSAVGIFLLRTTGRL